MAKTREIWADVTKGLWLFHIYCGIYFLLQFIGP